MLGQLKHKSTMGGGEGGVNVHGNQKHNGGEGREE